MKAPFRPFPFPLSLRRMPCILTAPPAGQYSLLAGWRGAAAFRRGDAPLLQRRPFRAVFIDGAVFSGKI